MDLSGPVFDALADPTRRAVMRCLSEHPSMTATELAVLLPVTRQAIAKHLAELEEAQLVTGERIGRENRFRLTPAPLADAVSWMTSVGARWDERLSSLGQHLATGQAAVPRAPTAVPGTPIAVPRAPTAVPGTPTAVPRAPTAVPGTPTAVSRAPTAVPGTPTAVSRAPTAVPGTQTAVSRAPTAVPGTPIAGPDATKGEQP